MDDEVFNIMKKSVKAMDAEEAYNAIKKSVEAINTRPYATLAEYEKVECIKLLLIAYDKQRKEIDKCEYYKDHADLFFEENKKLKKEIEKLKDEEYVQRHLINADFINENYISKDTVTKALELYGLTDKDYWNVSTNYAYDFIGDIREMVGIEDEEECDIENAMILNLKENTLDGKSISKTMALLLAILSNKYIVSDKEIAKYVYEIDEKIYKSESEHINDMINNSLYRLRKRGFHIDKKRKFGSKLNETIYIDY